MTSKGATEGVETTAQLDTYVEHPSDILLDRTGRSNLHIETDVIFSNHTDSNGEFKLSTQVASSQITGIR